MKNIATIMNFDEFKNLLESERTDIVIAYVHLTRENAIYLFENHSDRTNRKISNANVENIRTALDENKWDNNAGNVISFGKREKQFNYVRQVLDGGHRIFSLSTTKNKNAFMDVIMMINAEPSYYQDCGKKRTAIDQVTYAEIIDEGDFSERLKKALNIQIEAKKMKANDFYINLMNNYYDVVKEFDALIDLTIKNKKSQLMRYASPISALLNLYCLGDINAEDVKDIYEFFLNPEDSKYTSSRYNSLKSLNRILTNTTGGGGTKNKRLFVLADEAFVLYKAKSEKKVYNNENKKSQLIEWPQLFDCSATPIKKAQ